ncbi:MAG: hypothetical protein QOF45_910 [Gaiellaceae bacterium]|jgi:hypothetical protein|nr:hypothetical protein [Gaiellaceae bacterium]
MRSADAGRKAGAAALAVLAFVLAGCGGAVASQERPVATSLNQQNYAGLTVYSLAESGFSIGVPSGWTAMTAEDAYSESVNAIVEDSPKLAKFRDVFSKGDSPFKLVALEYDPEACICSTIYVLALPVDHTWKARDFEAGGLRAARKFALPGTKPKVTRAKTPAGSGIRITTRTKLTGTDIKVISTQFFLHTRRSAYVLTYTASPDVTSTYGRLFVRSARSLREI